MAKKKTATTEEFNMSAVVREALGLHPKASAREVQDYVEAKHPGAKINKGSFSVAFYTTRKKLGIGGKRSKRVGVRAGRKPKSSGGHVDMAAMQSAAKFLREVGSAEAAIEAIKMVQGVQLR